MEALARWSITKSLLCYQTFIFSTKLENHQSYAISPCLYNEYYLLGLRLILPVVSAIRKSYLYGRSFFVMSIVKLKKKKKKKKVKR